jgi:hypothetical protein
MPEYKTPKPEDSNKLSTLSVNGSLLNAFDPAKSGPYETSVPYTTENAIISATTLNSKASISGVGTKNLSQGINTFVVTCTPVSGERREYTIKITRVPPEESTDNRLKSLEISGIAFLPIFSDSNTGPYKTQVLYNIEKVTINAAAQSKLSKISGTGEKSLNYGLNDYSVTVTAEDGSAKIYRIQITREYPAVTSKKYVLLSGTIKGIPLQTTVQEIKSDMENPQFSIKIYNVSGQEISNTTIIGTGLTVKVYYQNQEINNYLTRISGDLNGDGKINSTDIAFLRSHILRIKSVNGEYLKAADINNDGKINSTDIALIRSHILRFSQISQS